MLIHQDVYVKTVVKDKGALILKDGQEEGGEMIKLHFNYFF